MSNRRESLQRAATVLVLAAGFASPTLAQTDAPKPALRGPEVKDREVPGFAADFGAPDQRRRFMDRIPPEVYRQALAVLTADDAPADVRASAEQETRIKGMTADFEAEVRAYREAHKDEFAELRKQGGGPPREGRRPGAGNPNEIPPLRADEMMSPEQKAERQRSEGARTKLRELMEGAPKPEALYTRIWAELSEPQKKAVQAKLDEFKADQAKRREEQYVRQRTAKKGEPGKEAGNKDGQTMSPPPPPGERPGLARISPERHDRLMRMFERLTPEEQDQLLERLEQRVRDAGGPDRPIDGLRRARPKPAPDIDKIKVPDPEETKK